MEVLAMFGSVRFLSIAVLAGLSPLAAWAGCGSAVCSINTNWDTQGAWTEPGARLDLRPGDRANVDLGYRHRLNDRLAALLQLNLLYRDRDSGAQAEPEDSGGHFAFIGPGLGYNLGRDTQLYGSFRCRFTGT
jgi:hypothetical protein